MKNITIIGSGSFGCALAHVLSSNNNIKIWSYKEEEAKCINEFHRCLLRSEIILDENIKCYTDFSLALENSEIIILVSPSKAIRNICKQIKQFVVNQDIVIATKGIENDKVLSQVVKEELNITPSVISGPSHAEEIAKNMPTFVDFSGNIDIINYLKTDTLHLTYITDMVGMQIAGSLKNIIALEVGICESLGYEKNTISYLIVSSLKEIINIGLVLGAKEETFYGLSGLGDILTTAFSENSRNRKAGFLLSKGYNVDQIKEEIGMVVEGFEALKNAKYIIDKYDLCSPIIINLYKIVYEGKSLKEIITVN